MSAHRRTTLLNESAVEGLIAAAGEGPLALRDRALLELLYGSGVRIAEALALDVTDLDLAEGSACVLGKGGKPRCVPLSRHAVAALRAYLTWRREGPVFRTRCGLRMRDRLARKVVERAAQLAGVAHSSPHTLRHSCASHMLLRGAYLFHVQELLGHQSARTTTAYLHPMPHERSTAAEHRATHQRA